jgi:hypothetical protein
MRERSRRGFIGGLVASLLRPARIQGQSAAAVTAPRSESRTYRADAVILLLGIPIYRRSGVGSGQASFEETGEGAALRRTFFFAGGSDPKRAVGLKRLGWIREIVQGAAAAPSETTYFGVLTSSPEESLEHARKSVAAPSSGVSVFSAVSGRNSAGHSRSAITHFEYADSVVWSDRGLIEKAQSTFEAKVDWRETAWPNSTDQAPATFLCQLAGLLKQRKRRAEGRYVYNEQEYLLELEAPQTGRNSEPLWAVRGMTRNLRTGHETPFRLWLESADDSMVPVRIEFQPRSFLRLTFESLSV